MARRRYQKPTPKRRGDQWTVLVREDLVAKKCNQLQPNHKIVVCKLLKMVARDGIEPPTPAFSGLDSSIAMYFSHNNLRHSSAYFLTVYWNQLEPPKGTTPAPQFTTPCPVNSDRR